MVIYITTNMSDANCRGCRTCSPFVPSLYWVQCACAVSVPCMNPLSDCRICFMFTTVSYAVCPFCGSSLLREIAGGETRSSRWSVRIWAQRQTIRTTVVVYFIRPFMQLLGEYILWLIDPLLGGDSVNVSRCWVTPPHNNGGVTIRDAYNRCCRAASRARWRHKTEEVMQAGVLCRSAPRLFARQLRGNVPL
jgi:hypothetical protein